MFNQYSLCNFNKYSSRLEILDGIYNINNSVYVRIWRLRQKCNGVAIFYAYRFFRHCIQYTNMIIIYYTQLLL